MQYHCRLCSSQGPLCHTTAASVRRKVRYAIPRLAEPKPQPLNLPTQNGSGFNLPNQNGIETEAASHLPTQNGGSGLTLADPKRLCLHICRTKTAATSTRRTKTAVAFDSDLPTQNGASSIAEPKRHQHGSGFTLADPKRLKRLHTCRPKTAVSSHLPNQNGSDSNTPNQNGNRFRFRPADPKRRLVDIIRSLS